MHAPLFAFHESTSVVGVGLALSGVAVTETIARRARGFLQGEAEIFPPLLGVMAEVARAARDAGAALRAGLRREQEREPSTGHRAGGDPGGEGAELLPVARLLEGAAPRR